MFDFKFPTPEEEAAVREGDPVFSVRWDDKENRLVLERVSVALIDTNVDYGRKVALNIAAYVAKFDLAAANAIITTIVEHSQPPKKDEPPFGGGIFG